MCRLFSLFLIFVSIATGWREKLQEKYLVIVFLSAGSAVAFSYCWAALLLMGSGLPVPSSLPFPSFFFKAAGIRRGKDAADAGIAVGYAEPICVNPVLSLPSDPPSPLLPCSNLRCHLNTMAKWKPWLAGGAVSCLQRASFPVCSSC